MLPDNWARPVVEAVTLPAHAQTTGPSDLQALSPFQSGEESFPIALNATNDAVEGFATLDSPDQSTDWDTLSDTQILDFFAAPAFAGSALNSSSTYQMSAQVDGATGDLCMTGELYNIGPFLATLSNTPVEGDTIKGGVAVVTGVDALVFNDFQLSGANLSGSFDLTVNNATSVTDVSVVLQPGGPGCM